MSSGIAATLCDGLRHHEHTRYGKHLVSFVESLHPHRQAWRSVSLKRTKEQHNSVARSRHYWGVSQLFLVLHVHVFCTIEMAKVGKDNKERLSRSKEEIKQDEQVMKLDP